MTLTAASSPDHLRAGVSGYVLRALAEVVQQRGTPAEALFGDSVAVLDADPSQQPFTLERLEALFVRAAQLTGEPGLGLSCALQASEASFGLIAPLVSHAATLREGLALVMQFHQLVLASAGIRLEERAGVACLRCELTQEPGRHVVEFLVSGLVRTLMAFGCSRRDIRAVYFKHPRPAHHATYAAVFAGAERFGQAFSGIGFSAAALDRPHINRESELRRKLLAVPRPAPVTITT